MPQDTEKQTNKSVSGSGFRIGVDLGGTIVDGTESMEETGERIFQEMLAVASGHKTKSEKLGVGDSEFVPWQTWTQM